MKLYRVVGNIWDVFTSAEGWDGWSRILAKDGKVQVIAGKRLSQEELAGVLKEIPTPVERSK